MGRLDAPATAVREKIASLSPRGGRMRLPQGEPPARATPPANDGPAAVRAEAELRRFAEENGLDERCVAVLRRASPEEQRLVMARGRITESRSGSTSAMALTRLQEERAKIAADRGAETGGDQATPPAKGGPAAARAPEPAAADDEHPLTRAIRLHLGDDCVVRRSPTPVRYAEQTATASSLWPAPGGASSPSTPAASSPRAGSDREPWAGSDREQPWADPDRELPAPLSPLAELLRQALSEHGRALQEAAARHEDELRDAARRIAQELGREVAAALTRGKEAAAASEPSPHAGRHEEPLRQGWSEEGRAGFRGRRSRTQHLDRRTATRSWDLEGMMSQDTAQYTPHRDRTPRSIPRSQQSPRGSTKNSQSSFQTMGRRSAAQSNLRINKEHVEHITNPIESRSGGTPIHQQVREYLPTMPSFSENRLDALEDRINKWLAAEEPKRNGFLADLVASRKFAVTANLVIFLNTVYIIWAANRAVHYPSDHHPLNVTAELGFTAWYFMEIVLKLMVHGWFLFRTDDAALNALDVFLVLVSFSEMTLKLMSADTGSVDPKFLRALRIFKVAKVLRMFRALRIFTDVRIMMDCVIYSLWPLVWAIALLTFLISLFSIFFVQNVAVAMEEGALTPGEEADILYHFGSWERASFSLLQASSGGHDWIFFYEKLAVLGDFPCVVFVLYIVFMMIAVMNIVTCVFLDKAMHIAKPTTEVMMLDKRYEDIKDAQELTELVSQMDTGHNGYIKFQDFREYMQTPEFRLYFDVRGLNIKDTAMFFQMLASTDDAAYDEFDGEPQVDTQVFVAGCMRLRGVASGMDMYTLSWELKLMRSSQEHFMVWVEEQLTDLVEISCEHGPRPLSVASPPPGSPVPASMAGVRPSRPRHASFASHPPISP